VLTELPHTRMTVELKADAAVLPVLEVLERTDSWHRVCLGGFFERWLAKARAAAGPKLMTSMSQASAVGLRSRAWLNALPAPLRWLPAPPVRGRLAQLPHRLGALTVVDEGLLRAAHAGDREVHVWTVNDPDEMDELLDMGVDGLLSDRPDLLRDVLRKRDRWPS
jgi:glycerophosphoryl diester phosphodiesterase